MLVVVVVVVVCVKIVGLVVGVDVDVVLDNSVLSLSLSFRRIYSSISFLVHDLYYEILTD